MRLGPEILILLIASTLLGCVPIREIRTALPVANGASETLAAPTALSATCNPGEAAPGENVRLIEDYNSYVLAFAEFDDQGWSYDNDRQLAALQDRLAAEVADPRYHDLDFAVVVFVHGWHHNAHDNDCNVQEARQMVRLTAQRFDAAYAAGAIKRPRRVFGIYAGWRGESVDADLLRYTTVIDRRDTAEKVAKGSIRQLLANLHEQQLSAQTAAVDRKDPADQADRMYTTVVGHSFGGLVVFNSLEQQLVNDLTSSLQIACSHGSADPSGLTRIWPNQVILINPAFEATRFEPLNRLADRLAACGDSPPLPLLTVITADNDQWTGGVFTFARRLLTLFEGYDEETPASRAAERDANLRAIGFVDRYRTHRLCLRPDPPSFQAVVAPTLTPASTAVAATVRHRSIWVVGAPPDIVNGHNGFLFARTRGGTPQPYLLNWLIALHVETQHVIADPNTCGRWP